MARRLPDDVRIEAFGARCWMNTEGALPWPYPHLILDMETMCPGAAARSTKQDRAGRDPLSG